MEQPEDSPLELARKAVYGPRNTDYGHPRENHARTAELWTTYLSSGFGFGIKLTARDVCMMNILQKVSRDRFAPKLDNLTDIAGYAENAQLCEPKPKFDPEKIYPRCQSKAGPYKCLLGKGHPGVHKGGSNQSWIEDETVNVETRCLFEIMDIPGKRCIRPFGHTGLHTDIPEDQRQ